MGSKKDRFCIVILLVNWAQVSELLGLTIVPMRRFPVSADGSSSSGTSIADKRVIVAHTGLGSAEKAFANCEMGGFLVFIMFWMFVWMTVY